MRGILAAAAAASVAVMGVASPQPFTLSANVLTLNGYSFGGTIEGDMDKIFQGSFCSEQSGNTCTEVRYLDGAPQEPAEVTGLIALQWALLTTPPPATVLGYSQGATIASNWIKQNAWSPFAPSPENLSFALAANPDRKYGGSRSRLGLDTPTPDTQYSVVDIAIEYDGAADFPDDLLNILAVANALAGFQYVHIFGYADVDLETAEKLTWVDGNTTYILIRSEDLPLLEPLRMLGLTELADRINGPLKKIIDAAYDRDYPGLVEDESQNAARQQLATSDEAADRTLAVATASVDEQTSPASEPSKDAEADVVDLDESETDTVTTEVDDEQDVAEDAEVPGLDSATTDAEESDEDSAESEDTGPKSDSESGEGSESESGAVD